MKTKKLLSCLLAGVMALALVACGGDKNSSSGGAAPGGSSSGGGEPAPGVEQVFRINIAQEPSILDPFQYRDDKASSIIYALHEPLLRQTGPDGKEWEPGLATDFTSNDDATVFTVNMRKDAVWSDGTPITAEDVVYSFQRAVNPANAFEKAFDYYIIKNGEAIVNGEMEPTELGVVALDEYTVEFTMERPLDYFVDYLKATGFAPIQKAAAEQHGELYGTEPDKMAFSGPFILESWEHDSSITLVKNPNYWDADNVKLDKVEITLVLDANSIIGMWQTGELDYVEIGTDAIPQYENEPGFDSIRLTRTSFIEFNPEVEFLNNIKIREALSIAFDRVAYATAVMGQPDIAAYGLVPYGMRGLDGGDFREQAGDLVVDLASDPTAKDRAVQLLEEGLQELGKTQADMEAFLEVLCVDSPGSKTQAQAIQAMWKEHLGLELRVTPLQVKMLIPMLMEGTFHCVVGGGRTAGSADPAYMIDFVYDENKWQDETFRGMIEESRNTTGDERIQILMDAEKYLLDYFVYIPQVYAKQHFILNPDVQGFKMYPMGVQFDYKYVFKTA